MASLLRACSASSLGRARSGGRAAAAAAAALRLPRRAPPRRARGAALAPRAAAPEGRPGGGGGAPGGGPDGSGALAALQRDVAKFVARHDPVTTGLGRCARAGALPCEGARRGARQSERAAGAANP
jgi:hypothetical protein